MYKGFDSILRIILVPKKITTAQMALSIYRLISADEVLSPNGGESWRIGETYMIRWNAHDDHLLEYPISLFYSMNNGQAWNEIAAGEENTGSYSWTIPDVEPGYALIKVEAADIADNIGDDQSDVSFIITVEDTVPPEMTVPDDVIAEATGIVTPVDIGEPVVQDDLPVTVINTAPDEFPLGTTTVTWMATDLNGNITTGTQLVTVRDSTPPELDVPADITAEATARATPVDIGQASATDIFLVVSITNNAPDNGKYRRGTTIVTWEATDEHGNTGTKDQEITIVDTTPPELIVPEDITVEATGVFTPVDIGQATASDIFAVTITNDLPVLFRPENLFPVGETIVTWTATDKSGNTATGIQRIIVTVDPGPFGD